MAKRLSTAKPKPKPVRAGHEVVACKRCASAMKHGPRPDDPLVRRRADAPFAAWCGPCAALVSKGLQIPYSPLGSW